MTEQEMKTKVKDIFRFKDGEVVPDELKNALNYKETKTSKIIKLFKTADKELTAKQLSIAYYKFYGEIINLKKMSTKLSQMTKTGHLKRMNRGVYIAIDSNEAND